MCKIAICGIQANKKKKPSNKALETLSSILENFDENNDITVLSGIHQIPKFEKDLTTIVQSLNQEMFYIVKTIPNLLNGLKNILINSSHYN